MAISVLDLKQFAKDRTTGQHSETEVRAAISRAYYAAFHAALPFVEKLPRSKGCPKKQKHISHQELTDRLNEWNTSSVHPKLAQMTATRNKLLNAIETSRSDRVKADYRISQNCAVADLQAQLERVGRIVQLLVQIDNEMRASADKAV